MSTPAAHSPPLKGFTFSKELSCGHDGKKKLTLRRRITQGGQRSSLSSLVSKWPTVSCDLSCDLSYDLSYDLYVAHKKKPVLSSLHTTGIIDATEQTTTPNGKYDGGGMIASKRAHRVSCAFIDVRQRHDINTPHSPRLLWPNRRTQPRSSHQCSGAPLSVRPVLVCLCFRDFLHRSGSI